MMRDNRSPPRGRIAAAAISGEGTVPARLARMAERSFGMAVLTGLALVLAPVILLLALFCLAEVAKRLLPLLGRAMVAAADQISEAAFHRH